jgi:hypothetical protein
MYCLKPLLRRGNFFYIGVPGVLVADDEAMTKVGRFFKMSGQALPLDYDGEVLSYLNVTECINCLNQERSTWRENERGVRLGIAKYVFQPERFVHSPIFKIPETRTAEVLLVERPGHDAGSFKEIVEGEGLTGLEFEELWSS